VTEVDFPVGEIPTRQLGRSSRKQSERQWR
jgi:hypothetical protein